MSMSHPAYTSHISTVHPILNPAHPLYVGRSVMYNNNTHNSTPAYNDTITDDNATLNHIALIIGIIMIAVVIILLLVRRIPTQLC